MSWVAAAAGSGFGVEHLPYGVCDGRTCVRIGDQVLGLAAAGVFPGSLNDLMAAGPPVWREVRARLTELLTDEAHRDRIEPLLRPFTEITPELPFEIGDYVDFYSSEHHASNVGQIFRPGQPSLPPNWKHLPIGYHGRAGTIVASGHEVRRPRGQRRPPGADAPLFGPTTRLDIEAEVGFVIGAGSTMGSSLSTADFADHVFGVVLLNDWSARDIQAWEYQPLGPFLGKSFATSIAAWVTPLDALAAARVPAPEQDPPVLDYLREAERYTYDLRLAVEWNGTVVSRPPFRTLYWTPAQQLAHLTVNGASVRPGDLYASGTVSGPERATTGCLLELTWGGQEPVTLADGSTRTFLDDGDIITIRATAPGPDGTTITLGDVTGRIVS